MPEFDIEIWSKEFNLDSKGSGYLERTWSVDECPLDWTKLSKGDIVNYIPSCWGDIYRVKIVDMKMRGNLCIQVEVLDIIS